MLTPDELDEINRTGRVYLRVLAGKSSPPVSLSVHNPLPDPQMPPDANDHIERGECPACKGKSGFSSMTSKTAYIHHDWSANKVGAQVNSTVPYVYCSDCGISLAVDMPVGSVDQFCGDRAVQIAEEVSGVPKKKDETTLEYNARLERMFGAQGWADMFELIKQKFFNA